MPWYKSGKVSVALNSNAVIGAGTAFIANSRVGDAFRGPDGAWYEVTNIASDTAMAIAPNYQGATNAAGDYALAPMQGYVKDSADALRALVNTYGSKLAALGTTGNYDILPVTKGGTGATNEAGARAGIFAAKSGANDDILSLSGLTTALSLSQGGTGNTTGTASKLLASAIIGTVSQSGGIPTGALFQSVTNANGTAVKFADGTMICSRTVELGNTVISNVITPNLYASSYIAGGSFAASFVGALPDVQMTVISVSNGTAYLGTQALPTLNASQSFYILSPLAGTFWCTICITAKGRWF